MSNGETPGSIERAIKQIDAGETVNSLSYMSWAIALINRAREAAVDGRKLDADSNLSVAITTLRQAREQLDKE
jgi:hypothetical protein